MNNIAIIPARGGSKRIPRKNIKNFLGKPVIAYSIEAALRTELFREVMVSTDDEEIAEIAKQYGAKIPFMRSEKNADDFATTLDVIKEVIENYKAANRQFEYGCCIYAAAPFVTENILAQAYTTLLKNKFYSVFPVIKYDSTIWRSFKMDEEKLQMLWPENVNKRTQDLPVTYHDAGQFYWFEATKIVFEKALYTANTGAIIADELHVQDIDTEDDWLLAEFKYKYLQNISGTK